jgi:hypothetical protein
MKRIIPKPEIVRIFSYIFPNLTLIDKRPRHMGIVIGTVSEVAKQYNVKTKKTKNGMIFSATKNKMQIFVEKLHFSGITYWEMD